MPATHGVPLLPPSRPCRYQRAFLLGQSVEPHVFSNGKDGYVEETMKNLNDKLSAALLTIREKEDLLKQHAKVTEEAVAGWEQAETEVAALKGLLEASSQKNAALEDRASQLDEALKGLLEASSQKNAALEDRVSQLQEVTQALENEIEKEKALNEELSAQLDMETEAERTHSLESVKESFEEQLQFANSEAAKLRDMVSALEHDVEKEKEFSTELQMKLDAAEGAKRILESEVESAHQDARKLYQKVESMEAKLKEQISSAEEFNSPYRWSPLDFRNSDAESAVFADDLYDFDLPNENESRFSPLPSVQPSSPPSELQEQVHGCSHP